MTKIDIDAVRAAIDTADLRLNYAALDSDAQRQVNEHFPAIVDLWLGLEDPDPYGALRDLSDAELLPPSLDIAAAVAGALDPAELERDAELSWDGDLARTFTNDILSAFCHTIRSAIETATGEAPSSSGSNLHF